jgi:rhodanese-related sulfurtransferase
MKKYKYQIITALGILLIIILVTSLRNQKPDYKLTPAEILEEVQTYADAMRPELVVDLLITNDTVQNRFVDLRSPQEFAKGHIPTAINIPSHVLLQKETLAIFKNKKVNFILYHNSHNLACGPWMVLKQLGFKNIKILMGGFDIVENHIFKNFGAQTANYKDEKPLYNFAKVGATNGVQSSSAPVISAPAAIGNKPASSPKKKSGGGGC